MVEVLLAMLIVTVGLTAVIQSMSQALGATASSLEYTAAALAADNAAARVWIERNGKEATASWTGELAEAADDLHCRAEAGTPETDLPSLQPFVIKVSWHSGHKDGLLDMESYLFTRKTATGTAP